MKTTDYFRAKVGRKIWLLTGVLLWLAGVEISVTAQDKSSTNAAPAKEASTKTDKPDEPEPGEYNNYLSLGLGHFFVDGDVGQFKRKQQRPDGMFGGIEELHYEQMVGKKGLLELDGRSIFDNRDYSLKLGLSHPDIGYARGGYSEFRTWYDGSGGYSVRSNAWLNPYTDELYVRRGRAWFEGGLTLPDWPVLSVRYSYDFREGMKDSTIWGDYNLTLTPTPNSAVVARGIIPTFLDINERRHLVEADVKHTLGITSFDLGLRYGQDNIDNSRNILRRQGEPTRVRAVTQKESVDSDMFNLHGLVEARFNPKVLFTMGGSYTRLDTDIGGSRIYGAGYNSSFSPISPNQQSNDEGFVDLTGGSRVDQYVANLNLMLTPVKDFVIVPSLRIEYQDQAGIALFTETRVTNATNAAVLEDVMNSRLRRFIDVTESLEMRYTGLTNWSLYARGEWLEGQGSLNESQVDLDVGTTALLRQTDSERLVQKYVAGANWYPHRKVNFAGQYYFRSVRNDYEHNIDPTVFTPATTNNLYPAFMRNQEYHTHDVNFRMTWRPQSSMTFVSRYDYQVTSYNMQGGIGPYGVALADIENAEATSHIISQSASWTPLPRLYCQASVTFANQHTYTPAATLTGAAANLVQNGENDYWTGNATVGYALTKRSDIQVQYNCYFADNYSDNSSVSLPYGAGAEQHGVTATLINRLRKNLTWKLQYGYYTGHDRTSGGNNDYRAHLVYSSWQFLF
ncbi:MAG: TonB-dependent receptor [Verrucomicrobia bacterium]|nr:TonB-dependent receptor [Verrucomicrobiota bacterium]